MQEDVNSQAPPFDYFGSDFVGRIVAKGYSVDEFEIGQRVIPNCAYPDPPFQVWHLSSHKRSFKRMAQIT